MTYPGVTHLYDPACAQLSVLHIVPLAGLMKVMAKTQNLAAIKAPPTPEKMYPHGLKSLSPQGKRMDAIIQELGHVRIQDFEKSQYVKPESVYYEIAGTERRWYDFVALKS